MRYLDDSSLIKSRLLIIDNTVCIIESLAFISLVLLSICCCLFGDKLVEAAATSTVTDGCELTKSFTFISKLESLFDKCTSVTNNLLIVLLIYEKFKKFNLTF